MGTRLFVSGLLLLLSVPLARAHELSFTEALVLFKRDGTYQVDIRCDLDALALGVSPTTDSAAVVAALRSLPEEELALRVRKLEGSFARRVRLRFDGETALPAAITFPEWGTALAEEAEVPTILGLTARLVGRIPPGAEAFTLQLSRAFPPVELTLLEGTTLAGRREVLEQGGESTPYPLGVETPEVPRKLDPLTLAGRYLVLGFWHIVPEGVDHILFVLGLFLLSTRWKPLLWQVSAFTVAHTVTLALSSYGVVRLSPAVVEPLIALSIACVAVENLLTSELKPWRPALVFAFGLLHGLGFAGVLGELGLPAGELLPALLSFNLGVELGQLAVLGGAFLLLGLFRHRPWYRRWVVLPLSGLIAIVGLYWAVVRVL